MPVDASQLLKRLDPVVRSAEGAASRSARGAGTDAPSFDRMLALVSRSSGVAGRSVLFGFQPEPALDPQQMGRLSAAAELAAEAGAERALMLLDGRAFVMDTGARELTAELSGSSRHELIELDAAVYVAPPEVSQNEHDADEPGSKAEQRRRSAVPPGLRAWVPPSVASQLEAATRGAEQTERTSIDT